jgi:hypothetical protein
VSRRRFIAALAAAGLVGFYACSSDSGGTGPVTDGITLTVSANTITVVQGGNTTLTATVGRTGNFNGPIAVTIEGLPANVTAAATPASVPAGSTSSTITINAAAAAATGNTTLTIRAAGTGVSARTATVTLTVSSSTAPGFNMALSTGALSIQQGAQNNSATITLTRLGGFNGSVSFSQTGAPNGMTVTFNPASTTANTSTITVAVGAAVAAQTYQLTIRGTATGQADRTATLAVTVTTAGGGGGNSFRACNATMLFAAYQDGTGAWTAATITGGNTFNFTMPSGRGGVAYVSSPTANTVTVNIQYGIPAELNTGAITCPTPPATKSLLGSIANVTGLTERADIGMGGGFTTVIPLIGTTFTLNNVINQATDLLAGRINQTMVGSAINATMNKAIIRRGINPAAGSTLPVLDFNAAESFTPVTRTLTLNNLGTDVANVTVGFLTNAVSANLSALGMYLDMPTTSVNTWQHPTIPNTQAGDLHGYSIFTTAVGGTSRAMQAYFRDGQDRTLTLGAPIGPVTVTTASTTPVRFRSVYTVQNDYSAGIAVNYSQPGGGGVSRFYNLNVSQGYLAGSTAFDFTIPDFSALTGWQAAWNMLTGTQVSWSLTGTGGNLTQLDGGIGRLATRTGTITP